MLGKINFNFFLYFRRRKESWDVLQKYDSKKANRRRIKCETMRLSYASL